MEDKVFLRKVRLKLLKEGRVKEAFQVNSNGYSFGKVENGKYRLGVSAKNKDREVYLIIDEKDEDLGYEIMNLKHRRGAYPKPNLENKYKVSTIELEAMESYLKVSIANISGELSLDDFKFRVRNNPLFNIMVTEYHSASYYREIMEFKDDTEYKEFCKKGYRVIEEDLTNIEGVVSKYLRKKHEIKEELEKEIRDAEEYMELNIKENNSENTE